MENEELLQSVKTELKITKIVCILSLLVTLGMALAFGYLCTQLQPVLELADQIQPVLEAVNQVQPVLEQLSGIDTDELNSLIEQAGPVLEQLSQIDTDAINELLGNYDSEEIQQTLENLNSALETLNSVSEKLGKIGSIFK